MKHLKTLGLIGLVIGALLSLAGSASATALTSNGATYTGEFVAKATGVRIHRPTFGEGKWSLTCNSTISGKVSGHGAAVTATVVLGTFFLTECVSEVNPNAEAKILKPGTLEIHTASGDSTGSTGNGTVTWSGPFELTTSIGPVPINEHCIFKLSNADIGSITGSKNTGATAKFNLDALLSTNLACGVSAELTGTYTVNTPDNLNIH
ncbi:MAG TPA: hypothetical protein VFJ61_04050 [Solirubrobacterales bacterium]|nr:hypothetical protein [Solirubrobacterales bacterium]